MAIGTPTAGWYPDHGNPAERRYWDGTAWTTPPAKPVISVGGVFGRTFAYGLVIAAVAGAASGTAGFPLVGTILGGLVGLAVGIPVSLVVATVIALSARPSVTAKTYRRSVDVTLLVLAAATTALAVVWINQHALTGPWPPLAMLAVVVIGLVGTRPLLRRMAPTEV
jgi:hypothetical protein